MSLLIRGTKMMARGAQNSLLARPFGASALLTSKSPHLETGTDQLHPSDTQTHTGQKFEEADYRLVRFIGKEKQVNTSFAIDLIAQVPPAEEKKRVVSCDGGGGPTGHPKVYINLDSPGNHACGYCGLRFYKDAHHH